MANSDIYLIVIAFVQLVLTYLSIFSLKAHSLIESSEVTKRALMGWLKKISSKRTWIRKQTKNANIETETYSEINFKFTHQCKL